MSLLSLASTLLLAISIVTAHNCQNITVPVSLSARNGVFNFSIPQTNIEVTNFILNAARQGHNGTAEVLTDYTTVSDTYNIQTTFCQPEQSSRRSPTVQLLTHGIGFDRSYWDLQYEYPDYSYTNVAVNTYGYSTLSWDRLGIGMSQHGDPLTEIQAPLEEAALIALTQLLKSGNIPGVSQKFDKVIHVGHSFGAILSYALSRDMPTLSSGLVLTGWSANATFLPYFLLGGNFVSVTTTPLASQYTAGYFAPGNPSGVQTNFFAPNHFDPNILPFAYATGQPVSVGELLTIGGIGGGATSLAAPIMIIAGARDLPFCGGDCLITGTSASSIPAEAAALFPNTTPYVVVQPDAGHALNMDQDAQQVFTTINDWLKESGLGMSDVWRPRRSWRM